MLVFLPNRDCGPSSQERYIFGLHRWCIHSFVPSSLDLLQASSDHEQTYRMHNRLP